MRMTFKTAATALALCLVFQVQADTLLGKVINVADGDTITVLDDTHTQHKINRPLNFPLTPSATEL
jgi:endonuclease YncB( thermonuclease family)